jgi:uncharacterized protein YaiE (UPF0345 family)
MSIPRNLSIIADTLNSDGTFASISNTGSTTLSGGTANGVAYLNGSKVLTTGSALSFDGTNLGIGTSSPAYKLDVRAATAVAQVKSDTATNAAYFVANNTGGDFYIGRENSAGSTFGTTAYSSVLWSAGAYPMAFFTNGTERMRIDSSGNVGIGTTTMTGKFNVTVASNASFQTASYFTNAIDADIYTRIKTGVSDIGCTTSTPLTFSTASTERMRIDSSGNVGIGVTPSAWSSSYKVLEIGSNSYVNGLYVGLASNAYNNGTNWIYKTTNYASRYESNFNAGGIHAWFNAPSGTAGNAITFTQAMTLDASGNLLVGTTDSSGGNTTGFEFYYGAGSSRYYIGHITGTVSGTNYIQFNYNGAGIGSITQSGTTAVLFNVTSDQRLKENIVDAPEFGSLIDSLQVRSFDWKTDNTHQRAGFIAQELVNVAPEAVHQPVNEEDMMAVDYSKLVPMLVKEIQSLRKRLTALESKEIS